MTDGTVQGTSLLTLFNNQYTEFPANLTDVNGMLYFSASDSAHGIELWKSDGTTANSTLVKDISPGTPDSDLSNFTNSASQLFFVNNGSLWSSDGTDSGTAIVDNIDLAGPFIPNNLKGTEDKLYMAGYSYQYSNELYVANTSSPARARSERKNIVVIPRNKFSAELLKNPVNEQLAIRIKTDKTQRAEIIITNSEGQRIIGISMKIVAGTNTLTVNTASWNHGIYFVKVIGEDGSTKTLEALK